MVDPLGVFSNFVFSHNHVFSTLLPKKVAPTGKKGSFGPPKFPKGPFRSKEWAPKGPCMSRVAVSALQWWQRFPRRDRMVHKLRTLLGPVSAGLHVPGLVTGLRASDSREPRGRHVSLRHRRAGPLRIEHIAAVG